MTGCCIPEGASRLDQPSRPASDFGRTAVVDLEMVTVPTGQFQMGDAFNEGYPDDGELPVHQVYLQEYRISTTTVTNSLFNQFVQATGYVTGAERAGSSAVFHLAVVAPVEDIVGPLPAAPWWIEVRGADWAHPGGRGSSWEDRQNHPVVHVTWFDAMAFCAWAGTRLPSEAEWERMARGGHEGRRFPWGDELEADVGRCHTFLGDFPGLATQANLFRSTVPVKAFTRNELGIWQTQGNVWEWCADWFSPAYYRTSPRDNPKGPPRGSLRVLRGGSYLCHSSYCNRYRVAARSANTPGSSSGNCGFRIAG